MASTPSKDYSTNYNYPRALSSIIISVGLLAVFITLASYILLSHPFGTVVRSYFNEADRTSDLDSSISFKDGHFMEGQISDKSDSSVPSSNVTLSRKPDIVNPVQSHNQEAIDDGSNVAVSQKPDSSMSFGNDSTLPEQDVKNPVQTENQETIDNGSNDAPSAGLPDSALSEQDVKNPVQTENQETIDNGSNDAPSAGLPDSEFSASSPGNKGSVDSDCDLFQGEWFYDPAGPVYTNNTCPVITQMQNCQGNGRPDKEYESWRWKPSQCELPRFNGTKFLELMSGKTLAFVGDSVARNQMESLLCLLWQVEAPKNRGNRHMQRWYFRSKSVMIVRIWSSWLVHQTSEASGYVPQGVAQLHLDVPDETFMQYIPDFDVVVLSSGHWFAKQSVYMLNNEIVGTQLWSPPKKQPLTVNNVEAFGISVETSMAAMATHSNYTGLTILRSYSPDHYEGGAWNTGGSCTGKVKPILPGQLVENGFTNTMHEKQVSGFQRGAKKQTNRSKLKLMDITDVFSYRHDGHPGPYRSPDPNKITKRGPDGKPPPQDCLHWCMPGPVDTWNELVLEIIRREFEGNQNSDA
ncbi:protein YLS7-like [Silene latifolia]|uniref:protein YLS7-like n=1 Tax=Silene latifolia TaxID=37657 RepID=UPI003D785DD2